MVLAAGILGLGPGGIIPSPGGPTGSREPPGPPKQPGGEGRGVWGGGAGKTPAPPSGAGTGGRGVAKLVAAIAEKIAQLQDKVDRWTADGMTCYLFTNDHTPTPYDTLSDYSPCAVEGIAGIALSWPYPPADQGDGTAQVRGVPVSFTPTGTGTVEDVYGFFCVNNTTGEFQFAMRRDSPFEGFGSTLEPFVVAPFYTDADIT